jgi:hypothetical protein
MSNGENIDSKEPYKYSLDNNVAVSLSIAGIAAEMKSRGGALRERLQNLEIFGSCDFRAPGGQVFVVSVGSDCEISYQQENSDGHWTPRDIWHKYLQERGCEPVFVADRIIVVKPKHDPIEFTEVFACSPDGKYRCKLEEKHKVVLKPKELIPELAMNDHIGDIIEEIDSGDNEILF